MTEAWPKHVQFMPIHKRVRVSKNKSGLPKLFWWVCVWRTKFERFSRSGTPSTVWRKSRFSKAVYVCKTRQFSIVGGRALFTGGLELNPQKCAESVSLNCGRALPWSTGTPDCRPQIRLCVLPQHVYALKELLCIPGKWFLIVNCLNSCLFVCSF